jgi:hypothetical protein
MPEGLLTETAVDNSSQAATQTGESTDIFASVAREARFSNDGNDKLARFKDDPGLLASSYLEQEKMNSGRIKIPGQDAGDEEKSAFYQKLGRPDSVQGYNLPQLAEGQEYDKELIATMQGIAFESGVSDSQFSGLVAKFVEAQGASQEAQLAEQNREAETTISELQTEWGQDYDKNIEVSRRALKELIPDGMDENAMVALIESKNLDNNKDFVKFLQNIGAKILDDTYVKGERVQEKTDDYIPKYVNSPSMYRNDETEDGQKARAYFQAKGITI